MSMGCGSRTAADLHNGGLSLRWRYVAAWAEEALALTAADALAAMADCQYDWSTTICARAEKKKMISNLRQAQGVLKYTALHLM